MKFVRQQTKSLPRPNSREMSRQPLTGAQKEALIFFKFRKTLQYRMDATGAGFVKKMTKPCANLQKGRIRHRIAAQNFPERQKFPNVDVRWAGR